MASNLLFHLENKSWGYKSQFQRNAHSLWSRQSQNNYGHMYDYQFRNTWLHGDPNWARAQNVCRHRSRQRPRALIWGPGPIWGPMDPMRSAPGVVYIESVVFYNTFHIHHQIVHTSHFPIFSRAQPGGGVYLWGPSTGISELAIIFYKLLLCIYVGVRNRPADPT